MIPEFREKIFTIKDATTFNKLALDLFYYQADNNPVYKKFINSSGINIKDIRNISNIPFLPVDFFKTHKVLCEKHDVIHHFHSSGTSSDTVSVNYISDLDLYVKSFIKSFEIFYGNPAKYMFLALMPSFTEKKNSSLAYMVNKFIEISSYSESGFYLNNTNNLVDILKKEANINTILFGLSFALLDLTDNFNMDIKSTIVIETGGMKGKRREILRKELHSELCKKLGVSVIHSEYGMSELFSQAWSNGHGIFKSPPWMKILIRDPYDPYSYQKTGQSGGINIIDLANINTCAFIATKDIGVSKEDDTFEILGRFDNSDLRGCNLMI